MEEGNLAILVDAKSEYTKQLIHILKNNIYNGIRLIYQSSKYSCIENDKTENTLQHFQELLSEIPKWNQEIIDGECLKIKENSNCDWLEDLITAVFVSHTRILTSINFSKNKKKINLKIPKVENFIHKCYIDVARSFWKTPYLFDDSISKYDFQRNRRDVEHIIEGCIEESIRKQLPVKHILKEYLGIEYQDEPAEEEVVEDAIPNKYKENLRKMVQTEIENLSNEKLNIETSFAKKTTPEEALETPLVEEPSALVDTVVESVVESVVALEPSVLVDSVVASVVEEPSALVDTVVESVVALKPSALVDTVVESVVALEPSALVETPLSTEEPSVETKIPDDIEFAETTHFSNPETKIVSIVEPVDVPTNPLKMTIELADDFNIDTLDEINLDTIIDTEMNKLSGGGTTSSSDLKIEDLDLDLDLYNVDRPTSNYSEPDNNVKTIVLDTTASVESDVKKSNLLKNYIKKKDYSFFDE